MGRVVMGRVVHGASCAWGKLSVGQAVIGRVVHGASCPWGELSLGRVVHGASCPWGGFSMGWFVYGASCRGASFDGASCPWGEFRWREPLFILHLQSAGLSKATLNSAACKANLWSAALSVANRVSLSAALLLATFESPPCLWRLDGSTRKLFPAYLIYEDDILPFCRSPNFLGLGLSLTKYVRSTTGPNNRTIR
jgi:hypothetical protein